MPGELKTQAIKHDDTNLDPYKFLIIGLIRQAISDCSLRRAKKDPLRGLDAITFLIECGHEYCEMAGWDVDPQYFEKVLNGLV
jgi:hypothetical protein